MVLRRVEEEKSKYYRETIYTVIENEVKDEDVDSSILETEQYSEYKKIYGTYNATKEIQGIRNFPENF